MLPALNEEETVGSVVDTISPLLGGLVDELIVLDSGSTDDTEIRAIAAGARVVSREQALPEVEPVPGKGEVLWRSLAATTGDIVVFVDSDLIEPDPMFVPWLVGPLLTGDGIHLVKGFYRRPLKAASGEDAHGGGGSPNWSHARCRLRAAPGTRCVIQPLGGEYAGTRELLTSLPFAPGYGVEIGILIDTYDRLGLTRSPRSTSGCGPTATAAGRTGRDEPPGDGHPAVPLRHRRLRCRAHPVPARGRRLRAADHERVAGRPAPMNTLR